MTRILKFATLVLLYCILYTVATFAESQSPKKSNQTIPIDVSNIKKADHSTYLVYLKQNAKPPIEYVLDKFREHDVVILGEMHEVKENLELIRDLIKPLYHKAGVRCLATEFLKEKNTALANKLVTAQEYNEELALKLFRDLPQPTWGFKEYMDIFKAIWKVNKNLPVTAEKFRVLGLDSDWDVYDFWCGSEQAKAAAQQKQMQRDEYMAKVLIREMQNENKKTLVHTGYNHSFTHYRLPQVSNGKLVDEWPRFGYFLYGQHGDRIFQICLHQHHFGSEALTGGRPKSSPVIINFIEQVMKNNGNKSAGFDIAGSPFANIRDKKSYFFTFQEGVVFSDIARGYIFLKPLNQLSKITWVQGFIDENNFEKTKAIAEKRGWIAMFEKRGLIKHGQCDTPEGLDKLFKLLFESQ